MIGTITLHHNANYGANLQAYALVKSISSLTDEEVRLVDYRNERIRNLYRFAPYNMTDKGLQFRKSSCKRFVKMLLNPQGTVIRDKKFMGFRKTYIPMTSMVTNGEQIKVLNCSHLFVGSDQIWNDWITADEKNCVFFGNVKSENNILASYAASLGNQSFAESEDKAVSAHINKFDFLSVREKQLADLVSGRYKSAVEVVCDPVFLLERNEWESICLPSKDEEPYIFVYFLERNPKLFELATKISQQLGIKLRVFSDGKNIPVELGDYDRTTDPVEFVSAIRNAQFVVTNSFHGTVFSLLFHKKFLTVPDSKRSIRMVELLKKCSLEARLCYDSSEIEDTLLNQEIDYTAVDELIASWREDAQNYIKRVLQTKAEE